MQLESTIPLQLATLFVNIQRDGIFYLQYRTAKTKKWGIHCRNLVVDKHGTADDTALSEALPVYESLKMVTGWTMFPCTQKSIYPLVEIRLLLCIIEVNGCADIKEDLQNSIRWRDITSSTTPHMFLDSKKKDAEIISVWTMDKTFRELLTSSRKQA